MHPRLKKIYKKLPNIECKGLCHEACSVIAVKPIEHQTITNRIGFDPFQSRQQLNITQNVPEYIMGANSGCLKCPLLSSDNKCTIYDIRPLICRVFGLTKKLACPFGCMPDEWLKDSEVKKMLIELEGIPLA